MSHPNIVYNDPDPPNGVFVDSALMSEAGLGPEPPPVPQNWERLARPGGFLFGDSYKPRSGFVAPPLKVERGSAATAPVGPTGPIVGPAFAGTGNYNWMAVPRVTASPGEIVSASRRQLRSNKRTFGTLSPMVTSHPQPALPPLSAATSRGVAAVVDHVRPRRAPLDDASSHLDLRVR